MFTSATTSGISRPKSGIFEPNGMTANAAMRRHEEDERRERVQDAVRVERDDVLLHEHLQRVRDRLEEAERADAVRARAVLDQARDAPLHPDEVREHRREDDAPDEGDLAETLEGGRKSRAHGLRSGAATEGRREDLDAGVLVQAEGVVGGGGGDGRRIRRRGRRSPSRVRRSPGRTPSSGRRRRGPSTACRTRRSARRGAGRSRGWCGRWAARGSRGRRAARAPSRSRTCPPCRRGTPSGGRCPRRPSARCACGRGR